MSKQRIIIAACIVFVLSAIGVPVLSHFTIPGGVALAVICLFLILIVGSEAVQIANKNPYLPFDDI